MGSSKVHVINQPSDAFELICFANSTDICAKYNSRMGRFVNIRGLVINILFYDLKV